MILLSLSILEALSLFVPLLLILEAVLEDLRELPQVGENLLFLRNLFLFFIFEAEEEVQVLDEGVIGFLQNLLTKDHGEVLLLERPPWLTLEDSLRIFQFLLVCSDDVLQNPLQLHEVVEGKED